MSHFVVYVVGNGSLDEYLAPFQQNNMGDVPDKYLEFLDMTEEVESEWQDYPLRLLANGGEHYESIDEFAEDYFGYTKQGNRYGYVENPNAKWDWWVSGGRWGGALHLKDGKKVDQAFLSEVDWEKTNSPFACLIDGVWISHGEMFMFGQSQSDITDDEWDDKFKALMEDTPPDQLVTVVDCHI